jgi:hypothetical protein
VVRLKLITRIKIISSIEYVKPLSYLLGHTVLRHEGGGTVTLYTFMDNVTATFLAICEAMER